VIDAAWLDTTLFAGDRPPVAEAEAVASRPGMRFVDAPHARLRARIQRVPGAPALILIPDAPNTIEHYDPHFDRWRDRLTVVAIEAPGFGFSWASHPDALDYAGAIEALAHALRDLRLGEMLVTGPCTMAYAAIGVAAAMPTEVRGVIASQATDLQGERRWISRAIDPDGWLREPHIGQMAWGQPQLRERLAIDRWYDAAVGPDIDSSAWRETARWAHNCGCSNALATHVQTWFGHDAPADIPCIDAPSIILFGKSDRTHSRSDPAGLKLYLPNAQVRVLERAGHFPDLEDIAAFATAVDDILTACGRSSVEQAS
jgi:pimeloyl-ACP methyl ester carboxylesterase